MEFSYLFIVSLLILTVLGGVASMFFYQETLKKICCLSISYSNFLLLIIILSYKNNIRLSVILTIMVSVFIVFATNLFIGLFIAKNPQEKGFKL